LVLRSPAYPAYRQAGLGAGVNEEPAVSITPPPAPFLKRAKVNRLSATFYITPPPAPPLKDKGRRVYI